MEVYLSQKQKEMWEMGRNAIDHTIWCFQCHWPSHMVFPNLEMLYNMTKDISRCLDHFQWRFGHIWGKFLHPPKCPWGMWDHRKISPCLSQWPFKTKQRYGIELWGVYIIFLFYHFTLIFNITINCFRMFGGGTNFIRHHTERVYFHIPFRIQ